MKLRPGHSGVPTLLFCHWSMNTFILTKVSNKVSACLSSMGFPSCLKAFASYQPAPLSLRACYNPHS